MPTEHDMRTIYDSCWPGGGYSYTIQLGCMQHQLGPALSRLAFMMFDDGRYDRGLVDVGIDLATWIVAAHMAGVPPKITAPEGADPLAEVGVYKTVPSKLEYLLNGSTGKGGIFASRLGFDAETLNEALVTHLRNGVRDASRIFLNQQGEVQFNTVGSVTGPSGESMLLKIGWKLAPDGTISVVSGMPLNASELQAYLRGLP
jgi:hypothetical protein